jgi:hypothetical protein
MKSPHHVVHRDHSPFLHYSLFTGASFKQIHQKYFPRSLQLFLALRHTYETPCERGPSPPLSWVRSVLGPPTKTSLAFEGSIRDRRTSFMRLAHEPYEIVKCLSYIGRLPRWSLKKSALQFSCKCFSLSENVTPIFQEAHEIFLVLQYWSSVAGIPDFNGMGADLVEGFVSPVWFQNVKQP